MTTFYDKVAPSINQCYFFVSSLFAVLVISHFDFEDMISVLIVPVPGHCLHYFCESKLAVTTPTTLTHNTSTCNCFIIRSLSRSSTNA